MSDLPAARTDAWRRLLQRTPAKVSLWIIVIVVAAAIFVPMFMPDSYREVTNNQFSPPSLQHPFGTDLSGHDLFYRVLTGARISLLVGISGALISLFIGTGYGLVSGYVGGTLDALMMRLVEILYSIPRLIVIIIGISAFDGAVQGWLRNHDFAAQIFVMQHLKGRPGLFIAHHLPRLGGLADYSRIIILIFALGIIEWLTMARIVRGQVLSLKSLQFVAAARSLGQSHAKIILRHLLPNITGIVVIYLTLTIPSVILDESFLSFLGLGLQEPHVSWGLLLADGAQTINPLHSYWWLLVFPAVAMSVTLLSLNFLGDALRDVLDPRERR